MSVRAPVHDRERERHAGAPGGNVQLELVTFHAPPYRSHADLAPAHAPGLRHIAFAVHDLDAVVARRA